MPKKHTNKREWKLNLFEDKRSALQYMQCHVSSKHKTVHHIVNILVLMFFQIVNVQNVM